MDMQLVNTHGLTALAGLNWERGAKPSFFQAFRFGRRPIGYVQFSGRIAEAALTSDASDAFPLAWMLGRSVADATGVVAAVLAVKIDGDTAYYGAQFKDGVVVLHSEALFETAQLVVEWAVQLKRSDLIEDLYVEADFIDIARAVDTGLAPKDLSDIDLDAQDSAPKLTPFFMVTPTRLGILAAVVAVLFLAPKGVELLVNAGSSKQTVEVTSPVKEDGFAVDQAAFAAACISGLDQEWPGVPGWEVKSFGCVVPGAARPIGDTVGAAVWREYGRGDVFAAIPGSGVPSARMAAMLYETWPHPKSIIEGQILTAVEIPTSWALFDPAVSGQAAQPVTAIEDAFVGLIDGSVIRTQVEGANAVYALTVKTDLTEALGRAQMIDGLDVVSVSQTGSKSLLTFEDRHARLFLPEGQVPREIETKGTLQDGL